MNAKKTPSPFTTPQGYFENLAETVMERIDGKVEVTTKADFSVNKSPSRWQKTRTQLALAAGFALLVALSTFLFGLLQPSPAPSPLDNLSDYITSEFSTLELQDFLIEEDTDSFEPFFEN